MQGRVRRVCVCVCVCVCVLRAPSSRACVRVTEMTISLRLHTLRPQCNKCNNTTFHRRSNHMGAAGATALAASLAGLARLEGLSVE